MSESTTREERFTRGLEVLTKVDGEAGQRVLHALDEFAAGDPLAQEYYLYIGVPQQPSEFRTGCEGREGNRQRADARGRQPADEPLGTVGKEDPDPGAFTDAGGQQCVRQFD